MRVSSDCICIFFNDFFNDLMSLVHAFIIAVHGLTAKLFIIILLIHQNVLLASL